MVQRGGDRWVEGDEAARSRHGSDIDDRLREAACEGRSQVGGERHSSLRWWRGGLWRGDMGDGASELSCEALPSMGREARVGPTAGAAWDRGELARDLKLLASARVGG